MNLLQVTGCRDLFSFFPDFIPNSLRLFWCCTCCSVVLATVAIITWNFLWIAHRQLNSDQGSTIVHLTFNFIILQLVVDRRWCNRRHTSILFYLVFPFSCVSKRLLPAFFPSMYYRVNTSFYFSPSLTPPPDLIFFYICDNGRCWLPLQWCRGDQCLFLIWLTSDI